MPSEHSFEPAPARHRRHLVQRFLAVPGWLPSLARLEPRAGFSLLTLAVAIWMIRRYYEGIRHDGMFYAGQTLLRLGDQNLASDLFFQYGSQDRFSIFSYVDAALVHLLGWPVASVATVIFCQLGFVAGCVMLLLEFAPLPFAALGLAFCALHPFYGPYGLFSIGEPFTTARSFAEPILLFAVVALMRRRIGWCVGLAALGFLMHPLLAAPVWCLVVAVNLIDAPAHRRWWLAALGLAAAVLVTAMSRDPAFFFTRYDDTWWGAFITHTPQVSLQNWDLGGWSIAAFDVTVLVLLARTLAPWQGQFLRLVALVIAVSFLIAAWGAGLLRSVFITEIQIWRSEDLGHLLAAGLFPFLLWQLRGNGLTTLVGGLFILLAFDYPQYDSATWGMALGLLCLAAGNRVPQPTRSFRVLVGAFAVFAVVLGAYNHLDILLFGAAESGQTSMSQLLHVAFGTWISVFGALAGMVMLSRRAPQLACVLAVLILGYSATLWDHRPPFQRYLEAGLTQPSPLGDYIPPKVQVLWNNDLRLNWFVLKRPAYFANNQSAGLVFNRRTAMAFLDHGRHVEELEAALDACKSVQDLTGSCTIDGTVIREICQPLDGPGFIVLDHPVEHLEPNRLLTLPLEEGGAAHYGVYSCAVIRADHAPENPGSSGNNVARRPPKA